MTQLEKVLSMFNFKVPIIENDKLKKIKILGKGLNGSVYLEKYNQKFITSKVQPNFSDAPNFITINEKMICSNTQINELIISHFLTHLIKESYIHKFLGYKIDNQELVIYKEYIKIDCEDYFKDKSVSIKNKINIMINIFFILFQTFQSKIKGFHGDLKPKNILLRKTNLKINEITIGKKKYKIPILGLIPVLIDFGSSSLIKINNQNINIKRFNSDYYKTKKHNCDEIETFNYYHDLDFFLNRKNNYYLKFIPKEILYCMSDIYDNQGKKKLTVEHILNHKIVSNYLI